MSVSAVYGAETPGLILSATLDKSSLDGHVYVRFSGDVARLAPLVALVRDWLERHDADRPKDAS